MVAAAHLSCKIFSTLNDAVPSRFVYVGQVTVAHIIFEQAIDDSCIEVVTGTDGADSL